MHRTEASTGEFVRMPRLWKQVFEETVVEDPHNPETFERPSLCLSSLREAQFYCGSREGPRGDPRGGEESVSVLLWGQDAYTFRVSHASKDPYW